MLTAASTGRVYTSRRGFVPRREYTLPRSAWRLNSALPDVFAYLDHRAFLSDWFEAKKQENRRFSHRMFARLAKQRSPSLLKHIIDGDRNLTAATTAAFATAMKLSAREAAFFETLVQLGQAKTAEERDEALETIMATRRFRDARQLEGDSLEVLGNWQFSAIRELATRADFQADPAWIARALRPRITPGQAKKALHTLLDLGLLAARDGRVVATDAELVTPHEVADVAANRYHQGMLERAQAAVMDFPPGERHLLGLTVCIPQSLVPEIKRRLNRLQEELLNLADQEPRERVYQVTLALFPLSDAAEETP